MDRIDLFQIGRLQKFFFWGGEGEAETEDTEEWSEEYGTGFNILIDSHKMKCFPDMWTLSIKIY